MKDDLDELFAYAMKQPPPSQYYTGNTTGLNELLAHTQGLTQEEFTVLDEMYQLVRDYHEEIAKTDDIAQIRNYVKLIENLEGDIQVQWKFPYNPDWHYFTFLNNKCKCPNMDNMDRRGTPYRIYNDDCPLHSGHLKENIPLK